MCKKLPCAGKPEATLLLGNALTTCVVSPVIGSVLVCTICWIGSPVIGSATVTISAEPVVLQCQINENMLLYIQYNYVL